MLVTAATRRSGATQPAEPNVAAAPRQPPALRYVSVRRPPPLATCAQLADRGPAIDAIQIRRHAAVISTGARPYLSSARCTLDGLIDDASPSLAGEPDGVGTTLGGNEYAWVLDGPDTELRAGDEIVVTVLDRANEPYQVFAGSDPVNHELALGTLTGSGIVIIP